MKTILSIDGGGIRGIIPAIVLQAIEKEIKQPIASFVDLIAGTSTGGIIALGLGIPTANRTPKFNATDLLAIYNEHGKHIFEKPKWRRFKTLFGILDEKFSHLPLETVLENYFGDTHFGQSLVPTLISSYDLESRQPIFFKSWRQNHITIPSKKVARATSAAPTFFEPLPLVIDGKMTTLIDGGVHVNNPAMSAYAEARRLFPDETEFRVISIGTGEQTRPIHYKDAKNWGLAKWAKPILDVVFDGVNDSVDYQLKQILGKNYTRIQCQLNSASDAMDNVSDENLAKLEEEGHRLVKANEWLIKTITQSPQTV